MRTQRFSTGIFTIALSAFLICTMIVPLHARALAHDLLTSPAVIDEKAKQRDIIKESITITNTSDRPLTLFPAVDDVNSQNGDQTFSYAADAISRSGSLANWIELSRGMIELAPGEEKQLPFVIHVNLNAVPGTYHAEITFTDGETRDETLNKTPAGTVEVNLEVQADIKEDLQLMKFTTDRVVFSGDDVLFNYQLENNGNQDLQPGGEIRIYDRRGEEVATVDVNKDGKVINPSQTSQLASVWSAVNGFGQFKALITVDYGKSQTASVTDTVFFWIVPWKQMLGILTMTVITLVILGLYFNKWFEERHLNKLAVAGLLKTHPAAVPAYIPQFPPPSPRPVQPKPKPAPQKPKEPRVSWRNRAIETIETGIDLAVESKRLFTVFKRSGRFTPEEVSKDQPVIPAPQRPQKPVQPQQVPHTHSHHAAHGETIDLTKVQKSEQARATGSGHVVNLKKQP